MAVAGLDSQPTSATEPAAAGAAPQLLGEGLLLAGAQQRTPRVLQHPEGPSSRQGHQWPGQCAWLMNGE